MNSYLSICYRMKVDATKPTGIRTRLPDFYIHVAVTLGVPTVKFIHLIKILSWNMTEWDLVFSIAYLLCYTHLPSLLQKCFILLVKTVINNRYDIIISELLFPSQVFFMIIRLVQNRKIRKLTNQFKAIDTSSNHWNQRICVLAYCPN